MTYIKKNKNKRVIIQKAVERVYACNMLRQRCCLDISADKQYRLICEEGNF
jgi:hypothetical protein